MRFTSIGLQASADDQGRGPAEPRLIMADVYPLTQSVTEDVIDAHLLQLDDAGFLVLYAVGEETFFEIVDWPRVDRPGVSDIPPPPPPFASDSGTSPERLRVVEGESRARAGEGEREREGAGWVRSSGTDPDTSNAPPSPFCSRHPEGTDQPCRACGTARLRHSQWWQQDRQRATGVDVS
ncbi:hypothetical protein P5P86_11880 [Nocardioides sp. BP30]|uniref:hypothetical protein n=1 Tax=Nocardioides sp. BP30 TaxID=3036374 RepID=UPI002469741E|nr:hypothetical protein [Nocardioides sp. BP30]WGL50663.1 hypothetical protein P5P86_11880 [Nocardioides sp. BP30]